MIQLLILLCFILTFPLQALSVSEKLTRLTPMIEEAIDNMYYSGAQLIVLHKNKKLYHRNFGYTQYEGEKVKVDNETLFDVASLTKVVVTLPLMLQLVEKKHIQLEDPLNKFYPQFRGKFKDQVFIKDILAHYAGFKSYFLLGDPETTYLESKTKMLQYFLAHDLDFRPRTRIKYSGFGFMLFGDLIEQFSDKNLDEIATTDIFEPLGMKHSYYKPSAEFLPNIAATELDQSHDRGVIQGSVHDPNAYFMHGIAGNAGLFSTASDISKFALMILQGGYLDSQTIISKDLLERSKQIHAKSFKTTRGLGWQLRLFGLKNSFGHTGYTGTTLYLDDKKEYAVVFLTNRVHPTRETPDFYKHRKKVFRKIFQVFYWPDWLWETLQYLEKKYAEIFLFDKKTSDQ